MSCFCVSFCYNSSVLPRLRGWSGATPCFIRCITVLPRLRGWSGVEERFDTVKVSSSPVAGVVETKIKPILMFSGFFPGCGGGRSLTADKMRNVVVYVRLNSSRLRGLSVDCDLDRRIAEFFPQLRVVGYVTVIEPEIFLIGFSLL